MELLKTSKTISRRPYAKSSWRITPMEHPSRETGVLRLIFRESDSIKIEKAYRFIQSKSHLPKTHIYLEGELIYLFPSQSSTDSYKSQRVSNCSRDVKNEKTTSWISSKTSKTISRRPCVMSPWRITPMEHPSKGKLEFCGYYSVKGRNEWRHLSST
ncbi:hypothetical protein CEXT_417791 [Caerostris extrusa]|uniref:Uncharacterized protein n=1 Tax=Caerostris extrusa TaxID=172846 RepID=A0AAV4NSU0_CAEEX|nr:hypothetical protein CEXT_417791 [Caerostris extrusa]